MTDAELLKRFLTAMGGKWEVTRYSVDDDGKLRVHYVSKLDPVVEWAHNPENSLSTIPKIGDIGMLGFISMADVERIRNQGRNS